MQLPQARRTDLGGPVHWVDLGGPSDGPLLVCVHGLGGSHVNWLALAPLLTPTCRVVALDLAGFGRTRGHGRSTSVQANADLVHRFLTEVTEVTEVTGGPAILVGNSMGGLVTALEAASHPEEVAGVVLVGPALPSAVPAPGVGKRFIARRRRVGTQLRTIMCPVLLVHGALDRLVHVASARAAAKAHPHWRYAELPGIGHVPQLEAPDRTAGIIFDWLADEGAEATSRTRSTMSRTRSTT